MNTQIITIILLAVVVSFIGVQTYQVSTLKNSITGNAISTATSNTGAIDMTGWTENEIMNYEMHGTIPSKARSAPGASSPAKSTGMVGGC